MKMASLFLGSLVAVALATTAAQASTVTIPPGAVRDITLSHPIRLTFRLSNTGDCTVGLVGKDPDGHEVLNCVIPPGVVHDFETLSAKLASVTAIVQRNGTIGAVLQNSALSDGQEIRVPPGPIYLHCMTLPVRMYTLGDGEASRPVSYTFRYGSNCDNANIQVNVFNRAGAAGSYILNPINPTRTITTDDISKIEISSSANSNTLGLSFYYTRNP